MEVEGDFEILLSGSQIDAAGPEVLSQPTATLNDYVSTNAP
jgi:hypothetical protein